MLVGDDDDEAPISREGLAIYEWGIGVGFEVFAASTTNPPFRKMLVPTLVLLTRPITTDSSGTEAFTLSTCESAAAMASENCVPEPNPMWAGMAWTTLRCTLGCTE